MKDLIEQLNKEVIVALPTDTILGFSGILTYSVYKKLQDLKEYEEHRPYLILLSDISKSAIFANKEILLQYDYLLKSIWPGPITIVCPAKKEIATFLKNEEEKIALRVPASTSLRTLLSFYDGLFSTSANKKGTPTVSSFLELEESLQKQVYDGSLHTSFLKNSHTYLPSTIIELKKDGIVCLREGVIPMKEIEKIIS